MKSVDPVWLKEYGQRPQPSKRCAERDGSCGHRSISDCYASRVKATDKAARWGDR